ncbi:GNAT family N-acetyltransferase [Actinophytocola xanthii]|uniref:GNAT family N-acetyltransferase n=1 Tax=Actinophytocola xanthii TaxID=1912961 RepID=A0A1Q8CG26_9PSEU|nr:GNAT family N-acetyltransferase [Actinophytocola xanthii]OLF13351.1 GNAT family N-acetyltransferase [Actinophytocola xanthii]
MTDLRVAAGDELTAAELYAVLTLRVDVFVVEQKAAYPELDGRDLLPDTVHVWYPATGEPQAYLRLLTEPTGGWRIGRVCTRPAARGTGLGGRVMAEAMRRVGTAEAVLDAQTYAQEFYARFGFRPEGEPFEDDDGIEHITMRRPEVRGG